MRIIHCCFSCFYIDGYNYQENMLVREHVRAGHKVLVLASTENYDAKGRLTYGSPGRYQGGDGAEVVRLPYRNLGSQALTRKIRAYSGAYRELSQFDPDVILFHGACAWELVTVLRYKRKYPTVRLFVDSHEDFNNSARGLLSKYALHYLFYRPIFRMSVPYLESVLCVSVETMDFIGDFYGCPSDKIEYFPLGGLIFNDVEYALNRAEMRKRLGLSAEDLVFLQSGKFDKRKKLAQSLSAFLNIPSDQSVKYLISGGIQDEVEYEVEPLLSRDDRIIFLGWNSADDLMKLLCAADVYVQPGSQSATLQNSICCRCAVIVDDVASHHPFVKGNGWMVKSPEDLVMALSRAIAASRNGELQHMQLESLKIARQLLDYEKMAQRLTEGSS